MKKTIQITQKTGFLFLVSMAVIVSSSGAFAADTETLGTVASSITGTFGSVGKMITASSYIAGLGFAISAILKFKQHKDNPQQTPVGQPIGLVFIAAALLFLPSVLGVAGATMFGANAKTAGPGGTEIGSS